MNIEYGLWLIVAVLMIITEMLIPTGYFVWMGLSAFLVGLLMLALNNDIPLLLQIIIFGSLSVATLLLYKWQQRLKPNAGQETKLNRRGEQYINRIFTLQEPITNGVGKIKVDDSTWKVTGMDMATGTKVRVTGVNGTILNVEEETSKSKDDQAGA